MDKFPVTTATIDNGSAPRRSGAVAIVASAGGISALVDLLAGLPRTFGLPIFIAQHLSRTAPSLLTNVLGFRSKLRFKWAEEGEQPDGGTVYVVPAGFRLEVRAEGLALAPLPLPSRSWIASADALLASVALRYGPDAIGVVLSGVLWAGTQGARAIQKAGGIVIAQSEASARHFDMPRAARDLGKADIVFPPRRIAEALIVLADGYSGASYPPPAVIRPDATKSRSSGTVRESVR